MALPHRDLMQRVLPIEHLKGEEVIAILDWPNRRYRWRYCPLELVQ